MPTEVRDRIGSRKGFVWLKREITPKQRQEIHKLGLPGVGFLAENKRVYPNSAEVSHLIGHVNIDNQGIAGIEKWLDGHGLQALHLAGPCHRPAAEAGRARGRSARAACAARRADLRRREIQGEGRRRPRRRCRDRRDRLDGVAAGLRSQQPEAGQRSDAHQPPDHRRVRARLDLQGADLGDGARFRQVHAQFDVRRALRAALRALHDPRLPRAEPHAQPCRRCSPIRRTSAPRGWRSAWASSITSGSCARWASSTGCAPSCPKAPSRSCPSAGASSTPSPSRSATACRSRRCRRSRRSTRWSTAAI